MGRLEILFGYHSRGGGCYWHLVGGARDAAKHPTVYRTTPKQNCQCQSIQRGQAENPVLSVSSVATHRYLHFLTSPPGREQGLTQKDACWILGRGDIMMSYPHE